MSANEEIKEKERRVRGFLQARGLKALLLKRQANFSWMTGGGLNLVGIISETGVASLLITEEAKYVITNNIEARRMMEEEGLESQGYILKSYKWYDDQETPTVKDIVGNAAFGCDVPFPEAKVLTEDIARLRYSLTTQELMRYRWLGEKVSLAVEKTLMETNRGEKESRVIGRLCDKLWPDRIDPVGMMAAADDRISRFRHPIPTERTIERTLMLSVNARKGGLIVCLTRFVHFGELPEEIRRRYNANVFIDCTFMAHTRPGILASEVLKKGIEAYRDQGYADQWQRHHQGGSIGYAPRDYRTNFQTNDIIQENQAFAWNPSLTGTKSEDTIVVASEGIELITKPAIYPAVVMEVEGAAFVRPDILVKD